MENVEESGGRK